MNGPTEWLLSTTGGEPRPAVLDLAGGWADIREREQEAGIPVGQPILISAHQVDYRITDYFREAFTMDRLTTALTYAQELRTWLTFLSTRDVGWSEAERGDVRSFQFWRVYDDRNPSRVTPATWNKGWAALVHFYKWAGERGWVDQSPVGKYDRLVELNSRGGHREKNARSSRDRWITPRDYALWTRVGLAGYKARISQEGLLEAALPSEASRARCIDRNVAFTDLLLVTGLRLSEAGTLLSIELPRNMNDEVPVIGKGGRLRHFRVSHSIGITSVDDYLRNGRDRAVRRGRREGRYVGARPQDTIQSVTQGRRGLQIHMCDGRSEDLLSLDGDRRLRLFRVTGAGVEPAAAWLTDSGTALPPPSWSKVFESANRRVSLEREKLLGSTRAVRVTPHSLRFTFALFSLLAGIRAIDGASGLRPSDPFLAASYSQVFDEVRDLLGHAHTDITRNTYLEPVKGLRRTGLLRESSPDAFWDQIVGLSNLVGFRED